MTSCLNKGNTPETFLTEDFGRSTLACNHGLQYGVSCFPCALFAASNYLTFQIIQWVVHFGKREGRKFVLPKNRGALAGNAFPNDHNSGCLFIVSPTCSLGLVILQNHTLRNISKDDCSCLAGCQSICSTCFLLAKCSKDLLIRFDLRSQLCSDFHRLCGEFDLSSHLVTRCVTLQRFSPRYEHCVDTGNPGFLFPPEIGTL